MKAFLKKHISWLPLILLVLFVLVNSGKKIILENRGKHSDTASPAASSDSLNCKQFCEGFISCASDILGKKPETSRQSFLQNACFAGCQKQASLVLACNDLVVKKKCDQATLCLQAAMSGQAAGK